MITILEPQAAYSTTVQQRHAALVTQVLRGGAPLTFVQSEPGLLSVVNLSRVGPRGPAGGGEDSAMNTDPLAYYILAKN